VTTSNAELHHAVILSLPRLAPCCDRCSDGLISKYFLNSKKIIFAVFDDLFSTITNYTGSDVTSAEGTAASRRQLTAHSEK